MADEALISVIVPIYNVAPYLDRCVDSLVKQTYRNLEIILVDDGSTDDSGALADRWGVRDRRITVYHKQNGGVSDARNYGIDRAQGQYLSFVDSDDIVDEAFIQVLYDTLTSTGTRISVVGYHRFWDEAAISADQTPDCRIELHETREAIALLSDQKFYVIACNKLYERSLFSSIRFPVGKISEDTAVTYLLIDQCDRVAFCATPLYFYRQRSGSLAHGNVQQRALDTYEMHTRRYQYLKAKYPEYYDFDIMYFHKIFEVFPYVGTELQRQIVADAAAILEKIGPEATLKMRLKYLAIRWVPGLYAWNKKRSMARYEKRIRRSEQSRMAEGPRNGRP